MAPKSLLSPPVIFTITGLAAALGCYAIYRSSRHPPLTPPTLHRSNAVHRRRRPRAGQGEDALFDVPSGSDPEGRNEYGVMSLGDITAPLALANLAGMQALRDAFQTADIPDSNLSRFQQEWAFQWLAHNYPAGASRSTVVSELIRLGLTHEGIEAAAMAFGQACRNGDYGPVAQAHYTPPGEANDDTRTIAATELMDIPTGAPREGQNLKQMLYYIAEHQSREEGYVHRGVKCNQCDIKPIRGIRWRCANCADYDLCSDCEAQSMHDKTHLFYKVKIPAPFLGNPHQSQPVIYPGRPYIMRRNLRNDFRQRMVKETEFELHEVEALYEQFTCLADYRWDADPSEVGAAIDRRVFDKTFTPLSSVTPPKPNLIYDRMFAFYDTNKDGLIGFEEFLKGLATLHGRMKGVNRLRNVFEGYDIDEDSYVSRKDFLRICRAFYTIQKEITRDLLAVQQADEGLTVDDQLDLIRSSQPLSAAFGSLIPPGERVTPVDKAPNEFGERRRGQAPTQPSGDDQITRNDIIGNAWELNAGFPFDRRTGDPMSVSGMAINVQDEQGNAVTADVEFTYNSEPIYEARVEAVNERWRRRQFYTDEEEGMEPPVGFEEDSDVVPLLVEHPAVKAMTSKRDSGVSNGSPSEDRSSPSSKLNSMKPRSNTDIEQANSSNSATRPVDKVRDLKRYKIPQAEKDLGKDIFYQVTVQGINELLDPMFKEKEDLAMAAFATKGERRKWQQEIENFLGRREEERRRAALEATDPLVETAADAEKVTQQLSKDAGEAVNDIERKVQGQSLDELLEESGYSVVEDAELEDRLQRSSSPSPERTDDHRRLANGHAPGPAEQQHTDHSPETVEDNKITPESSTRDHLIHEDEDKENVDPTLPHMRPSTPNPQQASPQPTRSRTDRLSGQEQENVSAALREELQERFAVMVLGNAPRLDLANSSLRAADGKIKLDIPAPESHRKDLSATDRPPTDERLEYLARLDKVEREIDDRGGPGRLSFKEFETFMNSEAGRKLSFVEGWFELGSF